MRQHPRHVRSAHRCEPASLGHAPHPRAQLGNPVLLTLIALTLALGAARDMPRPMAGLAIVLAVCGMVVFGG
ncbi:MAG TPA: hypothetical protein PK095_23965, partial [Myxococcota bacterium]|nr:hypothetical protein [Myxococcota bacterium]